jgi:hypothetical protein
LKQRLYPMRGFKRGTSADTLARGHALICNLRGGFSPLTATVVPNLRLATAWPQLMQAIQRRWRPPAATPHCSGARAGSACPLSRNRTSRYEQDRWHCGRGRRGRHA